MSWFLFTLACVIFWSVTDILYKASSPHNDSLSHYEFDYAAGRYEKETMSEFQKLFQSVVAAIVHNANTDGYDFGQLKKDLCVKEGLMQKIKNILAKEK